MEKSALLQITDIDTIKLKYQQVLGDRIHTDGTHSLYNRGVFDGMEILLLSISESMRNRKQITDETVT